MKPKTLILSAMISAIVLLFTGTSWARYSFNARMDNQENRIEKGMRRGEITYREHDRLNNEQKMIRREIRRARRSSGIDRHERRRINKMLDRADSHIYEARHNRINNHNRRYDDRGKHRSYRHHKNYNRPSVRTTFVFPFLPPPPPFIKLPGGRR